MNYEKSKQFHLDEIERLKREKPEGWRRTARYHLNDLKLIDDPFGEHEYHGTERLGRKAKTSNAKAPG